MHMQVRLRVPDIDVAMESREFEILQDAITHVCLAPVRAQNCMRAAVPLHCAMRIPNPGSISPLKGNDRKGGQCIAPHVSYSEQSCVQGTWS